MFTAFDTGGNATIASVSGECSAKTFVQYSPTQAYATQLLFNKNDDLVIDESIPYTQQPLYTFAHPQNGQLGKLLYKTQLTRIGSQSVVAKVLASDGQSLWASDYGYGVAVYRYPQGGNPLKILRIRQVGSIAVYPQLQP